MSLIPTGVVNQIQQRRATAAADLLTALSLSRGPTLTRFIHAAANRFCVHGMLPCTMWEVCVERKTVVFAEMQTACHRNAKTDRRIAMGGIGLRRVFDEVSPFEPLSWKRLACEVLNRSPSLTPENEHYHVKETAMMRCSHDELVERWALTYRDDGYTVRADGVEGLEGVAAVDGVYPDIDARREEDRVLVRIIDSPETLEDPATRESIQRLAAVCGEGCALHLVVAAECMLDLNAKLSEWHVDPQLVHVT